MQANSISCFVFCQRKGKGNSSFWIPFMLSSEKEKGMHYTSLFTSLFPSEKEKRNQSLWIPIMLPSEKGIHDLEFLPCFLQKKETEMHKSEFFFFVKKAKECTFLNSVFLFATIGKSKYTMVKLIFHFLVGQRAMISAEIIL